MNPNAAVTWVATVARVPAGWRNELVETCCEPFARLFRATSGSLYLNHHNPPIAFCPFCGAQVAYQE